MKKIMLAVLLMVCFAVPSFAGLYFVQIMPLEELEDFEPSDQEGLRLNNFSLKESRSFMIKDPEVSSLVLSFSARNKSDHPRHFSVMFVGITEDNKIIWADTVEPLMSTLSANTTETLKSNTYVGTGTLAKIKTVLFKIVGD